MKQVRPLPILILALLVAGGAYWHISRLTGETNPGPIGNILHPVDEAAQDAAFSTYRTALIAAVRNRDAGRAAASASAAILLDFGGTVGRNAFYDLLTAGGQAATETYWQALDTILTLGGVFTGPDTFCTPYLACMELPGCDIANCDGYNSFVATTEDAPVYTAPDRSSAVLAKLDHEVVMLVEGDAAYAHFPWHEIALADGRTGFVIGPDFRLPVDYRAMFARTNGIWEMVAFIAGD
jgi:hypothetical protein